MEEETKITFQDFISKRNEKDLVKFIDENFNPYKSSLLQEKVLENIEELKTFSERDIAILQAKLNQLVGLSDPSKYIAVFISLLSVAIAMLSASLSIPEAFGLGKVVNICLIVPLCIFILLFLGAICYYMHLFIKFKGIHSSALYFQGLISNVKKDAKQ